ncbi:MAG: ABC transporter ATP-binding protein [Solirubrobacteraceae bacterium]|nr:ABC transporter ATP-binding protein [Solirubrobacteraceae bacterium]
MGPLVVEDEETKGDARVGAQASGLSVQNLRKSIGSRTLFEGASFAVNPGEIVAVTGPSGCGKSTLLNCCGLLTPVDAGEIWIEGTEVARCRQAVRRALFRHTIGFVFQNYALVEGATVRDSVATGARYSSSSRGQVRDAVTEALSRVGLDGADGQRVYELSGGEKQRVALARLLVKRPTVVLADEPTGALDAENRSVVMDLLVELSQTAAILVVTHDPAVVTYCDRELRIQHHALITA